MVIPFIIGILILTLLIDNRFSFMINNIQAVIKNMIEHTLVILGLSIFALWLCEKLSK